ncbi:hypothetical protein NCAS_0A10340 [Naumovozyma castellii]|uniref:DNA replication complex GINS protein PSF1 n=1 Tax=Naumovozyma castellii TaxID=27288 RepID=G0V7Z4_NAUCA|nr:hypothetical protein NCAS_0A10340 [Naumovozyma castellii CBS 4309]CCC67592.1 hypothetical protein NCAS_0A10340 [Naumovozyma castellii CBS 4309]
MYGDLANKLILEAKRTQQLNHNSNQLPMYHEDLVRKVLREVTQLKNTTDFLKEQQQLPSDSAIQNDKVLKCQYFVTLLCMERNKRCLLAYQKLRSDVLKSLAWGSNDGPLMSATVDTNGLSHMEQEYLKEYSGLITELKGGEWTDIDLSGSLTPPSDVFIDVRVLKDAGEIQTEYGVFNLIKDSQFFVRQSDVERLIQQGYLQKI